MYCGIYEIKGHTSKEEYVLCACLVAFSLFMSTVVFMYFLVIYLGVCQDPEDQCVLQAIPSEVQETEAYV